MGSIAGYQPDGSATKALGWIWGLVLWIVGMFYIVINFCAPDSLDGVKGGLTEKYGTTWFFIIKKKYIYYNVINFTQI